MADTLLVIEDEVLLAGELVRHYRAEGWEVVRTSELGEAKTLLVDQNLDPLVVLSDMNLPDGNALDLLESVRREGRGGEWILLTGYGTVPDSVRAVRLGAYDFLEKPCATERLDLVVQGAARSSRAQRRLREQSVLQNRRYTPDSFVGASPASRNVREMLRKLAEVPLSAMVIGGETGTGKGLAARILHYSGPRTAGPLVEVNCAALPRELLESEIFGHEAGAFTGAARRRIGKVEHAAGGTLFLDEIETMPPALQVKLLRVLQERKVERLGGNELIPVDCRVVAATKADLKRLSDAGRFRSDLYYRLNVAAIELPALRQRREDIPRLVAHFLEEAGRRYLREPPVVPAEQLSRWTSAEWPGNVRELRNAVERYVLGVSDEAPLQTDGDDGSLSGRVESFERTLIADELRRQSGNVARAADALGLPKKTLYDKLRKHGLLPDEFRGDAQRAAGSER